MPDLSTKAVHEFWRNYEDPMIYRVISFMEAVEKSTLDGDPDVESALKRLGDSMEGITKFDLTHEELYIKTGAYLRIGRLLRLLQAIDTAHPGSASRVLMYAEEKSRGDDELSTLFIRRNIIFERLRLLARIFSAERLSTISKILEKEDEI